MITRGFWFLNLVSQSQVQGGHEGWVTNCQINLLQIDLGKLLVANGKGLSAETASKLGRSAATMASPHLTHKTESRTPSFYLSSYFGSFYCPKWPPQLFLDFWPQKTAYGYFSRPSKNTRENLHKVETFKVILTCKVVFALQGKGPF